MPSSTPPCGAALKAVAAALAAVEATVAVTVTVATDAILSALVRSTPTIREFSKSKIRRPTMVLSEENKKLGCQCQRQQLSAWMTVIKETFTSHQGI
jgi:hypothetical protein